MTEHSTLPKWAQRELGQQRRQIAELRLENAALRGEPAALAPDWQGQHAILDPYHRRIPLGDGHVRYGTARSYVDVRAERTGDSDALWVSASRSLIIRPAAGNVVWVENS
jgi:hypothetical protein